jgi:3-deoxy-7-phosphoheptulonate synthase
MNQSQPFFEPENLRVIAGPCSVEGVQQLHAVVACILEVGGSYIRAGAYKPRTRPESFQGLGEKGLDLLTTIAHEAGLKVVTELLDLRDLDLFMRYGVDVIQIGARNMYNYPLLKECGYVNVPILLKRAFSATLSEWFSAADYIAGGGNERILLCERGVRSFEPSYRNMLDLNAVIVAKKETPWTVIVDPSHACGHAWMVPALAKAAMRVGADGLMLEIHPEPEHAFSDGQQALDFPSFKSLMQALKIHSAEDALTEVY